MDVNDPRFPEFDEKFRALAEDAELVPLADPPLDQCKYYLFLYGDNSLSVDEEFAFLEKMAAEGEGRLKKIIRETSYWEDIALFLP